MKNEIKLSDTQRELLQDYIEDGVMRAIGILWRRAEGDVSELQKLLNALTECYSLPSWDFLRSVSAQYDPRPSYLKSPSMGPVDFLLEHVHGQRSKPDSIRFSIFKRDQKAIDNCKIVEGLMSIHRACYSKNHYIMTAITDPRLNTRPQGLSQDQWVEKQFELASEMIKQAISGWVKSHRLSDAKETSATQTPATPTITPKTEHNQTNGY